MVANKLYIKAYPVYYGTPETCLIHRGWNGGCPSSRQTVQIKQDNKGPRLQGRGVGSEHVRISYKGKSKLARRLLYYLGLILIQTNVQLRTPPFWTTNVFFSRMFAALLVPSSQGDFTLAWICRTLWKGTDSIQAKRL